MSVPHAKCPVCLRTDVRVRVDGSLWRHTPTPAHKRPCRGSGNKAQLEEPPPLSFVDVRRRCYLTQHQFGDLLGLSVRTVTRLESSTKRTEPDGAAAVIFDALRTVVAAGKFDYIGVEVDGRVLSLRAIYRATPTLAPKVRQALWLSILRAAKDNGGRS